MGIWGSPKQKARMLRRKLTRAALHQSAALPDRVTAMKFLSITQRLSLIVGLLVLTIVGIVTVEALSFRESMIQERREKIHDMATSIVAMEKRYNDEVVAGRLGLPEAKEMVRNAVRAMRWGAGDYYSLYQYDGLTLVHGNPKYENVNRMNFVDAARVRAAQATIAQ